VVARFCAAVGWMGGKREQESPESEVSRKLGYKVIRFVIQILGAVRQNPSTHLPFLQLRQPHHIPLAFFLRALE
jgi:hypothetical protein